MSRSYKKDKTAYGFSNRKSAYGAPKDIGHGKWRAVKTSHVDGYSKGVSATDKLLTKNANRGRKKSARQEAQRQIREALNK